MAAPPANMSGSELWRRLSQRPRPHEVVDFPAFDKQGQPLGRIAIQVLTQEEQTAATASAEATARAILKRAGPDALPSGTSGPHQGYQDIYDNECAVELLFRACREPDDITRPIFASTRDIRTLTNAEIGVLVNYYYETQARVGPIIAHMSQEEYDAWVELLAKGASAFPLGRLSWGMRSALVMRMAKELSTLRTGTTSSGSQPDETPSDDDDAEPVTPDL